MNYNLYLYYLLILACTNIPTNRQKKTVGFNSVTVIRLPPLLK